MGTVSIAGKGGWSRGGRCSPLKNSIDERKLHTREEIGFKAGGGGRACASELAAVQMEIALKTDGVSSNNATQAPRGDNSAPSIAARARMNLWFNMRPAALVVYAPKRTHRSAGGGGVEELSPSPSAASYLSGAHNFSRLSANQKAICPAGSHRTRQSKTINNRELKKRRGSFLTTPSPWLHSSVREKSTRRGG